MLLRAYQSVLRKKDATFNGTLKDVGLFSDYEALVEYPES